MDGVYGLFTSIPFENSTFSFHGPMTNHRTQEVKRGEGLVCDSQHLIAVRSSNSQANANSISAAFLEYSLTDAMWLPQHVDLQ